MVSSLYFLLLLLSLRLTTASAKHARAYNQSCRYIPGDKGWPNRVLWEQLNDTVNGRLIATVPLGDVCHDQGQFAAYDQSACAALQTAIVSAGQETLYVPKPSTVFIYDFFFFA